MLNFFDFGEPQFQALVSEFRQRVFEEVAASDLPGLIFHVFRDQGADVYFVELEADLEERLRRNETEFWLSHKASKRNIKGSRALFLEHDEKYQLISDGDSFLEGNFLKIDNTDLPAEKTARMIVDEFGFRI